MADMLASPSDLAGWLQRDLDTFTATQAIATATGWIQAETGQRLVSVTNETVTFRGGRPSLWLPERPVNSVGAVTTTDYKGTITARTLNLHYYVIGAELRWGGSYWPERVTVTYSHGYATIPEDLRGACLAAAARAYDNPGGLRSETVGGVSWTLAGGATDVGPGLTESERAVLAGYQLPVVA